MAIRVFIYSLLGISLIFLFLSSKSTEQKVDTKDRPTLSFHDSTLYMISTQGVESIVNSKQVLRYENRDVMYDGKLVTKVKNQPSSIETIQADVLIKVNEKLRFLNNVIYTRDDFITLKTDALDYNIDTKIAASNEKFTGNYYGNTLMGKDLYLDMNKKLIKANRTHFEIDIN